MMYAGYQNIPTSKCFRELPPMRAAVTATALVMASLGAEGATTWGSGSNGNLYRVDPFSGATALVGAMGVVMFDIAYSPTYGLMGVSGGATSSLYRIDVNTGAITLVANTGVLVNAATFSPDGATLYAAGGSSLYRINPTTGATTLIGSDIGASLYTSSGDLTFHSDNNLYLTSTGALNGNDFLYRINPATGDGTRIGSGTGIGFQQVYGLVSLGTTLYGFTAANHQVITIDISSGQGTLVNLYGQTFYGTATNAPDPPAFLLLSIGCALLAAGCGWMRRKRRRADHGAARIASPDP
jgi:hypothetical protein